MSENSKTLTRADLVRSVTEATGTSTTNAQEAVEAVIGTMTDALCNGVRVELRGFGSFEVRRRKPRLGRNPRSGEQYQIPSRKGVYFRLSPLMRDALNADE